MASLRDVILEGDVLARLPEIPDASVDCVVTSPPYWALRDYGAEGQIGLEPSWRDHVAALRPVFAEVHRVLKPTGNLFVNYGDTVATGAGGSKNPGSRPDPKKGTGAWQPANAPNRLASDDPRKHKLGLAWRLRFLLNDDLGFISRADIVWHKPNQMPLSVKDRVTPKYEMMFHFVKQPRYFYDLDPIRTPFAESTLGRIAQATFDSQTGGGKDYAANGMGDSMSARGALENLKKDFDRVRAKKDAHDDLRGRPGSKAFNLRVRDVKEGRADDKWGSLGVRATDAEVAAYAERPAAERRDKTLNPTALAPARGAGLRPAPEPGEEGAFHPKGANPGDVWTIPSQPLDEAHFATFPEELVRRCILSGSPEKVCVACGAPWVKVVASVEGEPEEDYQGVGQKHYEEAGVQNPSDVKRRILQAQARQFRDGPTRPSCACGDLYTGATVLDPFLGSGTTALVAKKHGRFFIGIELNPEYAAIARRRLSPAANRRLEA